MDMQVLRGTSSHFNTTTTCDAAVYATMGALVGVVFVAALTPAIVLTFVRTLVVASTGYAGLVALLTWEAELGRPLRWPQI